MSAARGRYAVDRPAGCKSQPGASHLGPGPHSLPTGKECQGCRGWMQSMQSPQGPGSYLVGERMRQRPGQRAGKDRALPGTSVEATMSSNWNP